MFIVVDATGELRIDVDEPTSDRIASELGGPTAFLPAANFTLACWINDDGWASDMPRNVLGTVLFWYMLGAQAYPVAGTLVVTGLSYDVDTGYDVQSLSDDAVNAFRHAWHDLRCIAGALDEPLHQQLDDVARARVRQALEYARTAPPPAAIKILEDDDVDYIMRRLLAGMN